MISLLDRETVPESVRKTGRAAVVHEGPKSGGFATDLIARINERALMHLEAPSPVSRASTF